MLRGNRSLAWLVLAVVAPIAIALFMPMRIALATVTATHVDKGTNNADQSSYTTTVAVSPTANRLQLLAVGNTHTATATQPTVSGCSLTWDVVESGTYGTARRLTLFRALSSAPGSSCTLTMDFGGTSQTGVSWHWNEFVVGDTTANGSNAVLQSVRGSIGSGTSGSVTLGTLGASGNATFGCFGAAVNDTWTAGANFTELAAEAAHASPQHTIGCEWRQTHGGFTTVDATFGGGGANRGIAIEIKDAGPGCPGSQPVYTFNGVKYCFPTSQGTAGTALVNDGGGTLSWASATPPDVVTFSTTGSCPTGWSEYTAGRGRTIVALPAGGTNAATVGIALTDQENRPVGQHTHAIADAGHNHTQNVHGHSVTDAGHAHTVPNFSVLGIRLNTFGGVTATAAQGTSAVGNQAPGLSITTTTATNQAASPGLGISNTGAVLGTNAPYVQLKICRSAAGS